MMTTGTDRYLMLGRGDLAREVVQVARECAAKTGRGLEAAHFVEPGFDVTAGDETVCRTPAEALDRCPPDAWRAVCCVGTPADRKRLFDLFQGLSYRFAETLHAPDATLTDATFGEGTVVFPGARVAVGARIGRNVLINFGVVIGHDTVIGDHSVLSPGVSLGGRIHGGEGVTYGIGASMLQGKSAGDWAVLASGSSAWTDIPSRATAVGVPARVRAIPGRRRHHSEETP
jgi:sugar O-acyltransferase (sialic acid O-acetyltransferase NeuD family)